MWAWLATAAQATTWTVPGDFPTIGAAVAVALSGDVVVLDGGVFVEEVAVRDLELTFRGAAGATWQAPAGAPSALDCAGAVKCTVRDITFDGGGVARAIDGGAADLEVDGCTFVSGASDGGGAIRSTGAASLIVVDSWFDGNTTTGSGGAIRATGTAVVDVQRSTFLNGFADVDAGAVRVSGAFAATFADLWVEGNAALDDGGGIDVDATVIADLRRSVLCDNTAVDDGAGAVLRDAISSVVGTLFLANTGATDGGALAATGGFLSSLNNSYLGNEAAVGGAAVYATSGIGSVNDLVAYNTGSVAIDDPQGSTDHALFWDNPDGDATAALVDPVLADPALVAGGLPTACDILLAQPLPGSPAIDAGAPSYLDLDGSPADIGAFGGSDPLAELDYDIDLDADGVTIAAGDCGDLDPAVGPFATEIAADGIDQDCDGLEDCWLDEDEDGFGTSEPLPSSDLDCDDRFEADNPDDVCEGFDDADDPDGDEVPTGCDPCPADPEDDSDGDGVCDSDDLCPGADDAADLDEDGVADCLQGTFPGMDPDDADGDGVPDAIDPDPDSAGADGVGGKAPGPEFGCGCASGSAGSAWGILLLGARRG